MNFLEKDLEDIIYSCVIDEDGARLISERGLGDIVNQQRRQVWKRQLEIDGCGIADIVVFQRNPYYQDHIHFTVIELKQGVVNKRAVYQCHKYIEGISEYLASRSIKHTSFGYVIGRSVNIDLDKNEVGEIGYIQPYVYSYALDGLCFYKVQQNY